jgi:hypothetical protein
VVAGNVGSLVFPNVLGAIADAAGSFRWCFVMSALLLALLLICDLLFLAFYEPPNPRHGKLAAKVTPAAVPPPAALAEQKSAETAAAIELVR